MVAFAGMWAVVRNPQRGGPETEYFVGEIHSRWGLQVWGCDPRLFLDPAAGLIEADQWHKANVEAK